MVRMHLVTWDNRKHYRKVLERYFRIRYEIYVKQRRWRAVARPINIEIDAFDNEHALYVLALDTNGKIVGGSRLVPTLQPHLMSEVFPGLAGGRPPRAAEIFEWTRFFVVPSLRTQGASSPVAGFVLCGLLEAAQSLGISTDQCGLRGVLAKTAACAWLDADRARRRSGTSRRRHHRVADRCHARGS